MNKIKVLGILIAVTGTLLFFCSNSSKKAYKQLFKQNEDTLQIQSNDFSIGEINILSSPNKENHLTFSKNQKVIDYDISPAGRIAASIIESADSKYSIQFWSIDKNDISEIFDLPLGVVAKAIAWHPMGNAIFVMGVKDSKYQIFRIAKKNSSWFCSSIFSSSNSLRRLVNGPRPFDIGYDSKQQGSKYSFRIFFGMNNGDNSFRVVSITEYGDRFYQVIGPSKTFSKANDFNAAMDPSRIEADWALPLTFHPAGHQLIWQDKTGRYNTAKYDINVWGESSPLEVPLTNGTITPTPNGLGFIHWQKEKSGVGIYLLLSKKEEYQVENYKFISTPSSVPNGKGIVGLTFDMGLYTLNYVPINVPLADVVNAWMFATSNQEVNLLQKNFGLFRTNQYDQIYKLYDSENYYCDHYDQRTPTRPYLVTTDIFWESFGAAYQGIFIIRERDQAIPNFWKFIEESYQYLRSSKLDSPWLPVLTTIRDLRAGRKNNLEVKKILYEIDCKNELTKDKYSYSNLKPRGHYNSSEEMKNYFRSFRYFTTIYKDYQDTLKQLNQLPKEITETAEKWIQGYSGLIAPSRSPLVWNNTKNTIPNYCQYPQEKETIFPLSWGVDNEIFYSTIYQEKIPYELRVQGTNGPRLLPSGLDIATVMGNGLANKLLEPDYEKYPPLKNVINKLKKNFKDNTSKSDYKDNLYNQWIDAIAVQWTDSVNSTNGTRDRGIWQTKRLQTGFATWATLRHATILVNERMAAECGEAGFESIFMRAPRGYVEPDPYTFSKMAELFESAIKYVKETASTISPDGKSLYEGVAIRLQEAANEARIFQKMAIKERNGIPLTDEENEKILYVARVAEHLFLVFNSLSNSEYGLSDPDPISKIADVAGDGYTSPYLMTAVGNTMEWDMIVPYFGRHQIVKGSIYSYYEFKSNKILNDQEWREKVSDQELLPWIKTYTTDQSQNGVAYTFY